MAKKKVRGHPKGKKHSMKNITINLPDCYIERIQWLISKKIVDSRSEAVRQALKEFLHKEYSINLELLNYEGLDA